MGALLGLAGAGLAELLSAVRARRYWGPALVVAAGALYTFVPPGYPREKARCFDAYQLGKRCTRAGNFLQALGYYDRAIALWPEAGEVWHDRGVALLRLGRYREAAESYERALAYMPESAVTWYALGVARHQGGQPERAVAALERAVALSPSNPRYRIDLGVALAALGRGEEAAAQWRAVLDVDPGNQEARSLLQSGAAGR
jgi:Flp pilus assembly protein TadD